MSGRELGVGVLGAHRWADKAHLPGYAASPRVRLVAICDVVEARAREMAAKYDIPFVFTDPAELVAHPEVEMVDVCTPTDTHLPLSRLAVDAGKHVLSEKPLARDAADAFALAEAARERGVRTKLGFTFRYSPALRMLREMIAAGELGEIFHVHGLEQNNQFLDPNYELRQISPGLLDDGEAPSAIIPSSVVGYGSHLVDLMRWCGGEFRSVVGSMSTYVPERRVRGYDGMVRLPIDDGTVGLVEFASGAQGMLQTSYVAIGNYPGVEIRVYGSKGAAVARLVVEFGVAETLHQARPDDVEFRQVEIPAERLPPGTTLATPWAELYYRNLVHHFAEEILDDGPEECTFFDGAKSQEIVDALSLAHAERRWVDLPA